MLRRGLWVVSLIIFYVSVMAAQATGDTELTIDLTPPTLGDFQEDSVSNIVLEDYATLPEFTTTAQAIFENGQANGRNAQMFSKIGDCMTAADYFLVAFGGEDYDLGEYTDLQPVVDFFSTETDDSNDFKTNAFASPGLATDTGFTTSSVLDSTWANKDICEANESPLSCEYRLSNPAYAFIMFGTNDVFYFEPSWFDYYLRLIVIESIQSDVVPVLYTFPVRPEFPEKSLLFNQIIVKIAQDYDLPLVNLVVALEDLPDQGVNVNDTIHLSLPEDEAVATFNEDTLQAGYTLRNLLTLQTLDVLMNSTTETAS
jgi:hypothetical protein